MPSACQRSSVRRFRRNSAASSSFVRNSERIGSELDMAITYTLFCVQEIAIRERQSGGVITANWQDFFPLHSSNGDRPHWLVVGDFSSRFSRVFDRINHASV